MSKKIKRVYDVSVAGRQFITEASSAGNACRKAFRAFVVYDRLNVPLFRLARGEEMSKLVKSGRVFTTPRTDRDNPAGCCFTGVSIECRGQVVRNMPKPETFIALTKRACERAGLPWIPPRKLRGAE